MKRNVSPAFAVIVIVFALIAGALYFLHQYNVNETMVAAEKQGLQQRVNAAIKSGRMAQKEDEMAARQAATNAPGGKRGPVAGAPKPEKASAAPAKGK